MYSLLSKRYATSFCKQLFSNWIPPPKLARRIHNPFPRSVCMYLNGTKSQISWEHSFSRSKLSCSARASSFMTFIQPHNVEEKKNTMLDHTNFAVVPDFWGSLGPEVPAPTIFACAGQSPHNCRLHKCLNPCSSPRPCNSKLLSTNYPMKQYH